MRSPIASLLTLATCSVALILAPACADSATPIAASYGVNLSGGPFVPDSPTTLRAVISANAQPEVGAQVHAMVTAADGTSADLGMLADSGDGSYVAEGIVIQGGDWTLELHITGSLGSGTVAVPLGVSCGNASQNSAAGASCCEASHCASLVCGGDALCAAPSCQDNVPNGAEADVDCGGSCAACEDGSSCNDGADCLTGRCADGMCEPSLPALGGGAHDLSKVTLSAIALGIDGLSNPRDLAFEPGTGHLWVVNTATEAVSVIFNAGTDQQAMQTYWGPGSSHFCAQPVGIAFGQQGTMATIHETDQKTQGPNGTPGDFMGPTLHSTDLSIFNGGTASHLDMLHNSPLGMGIAWESDNIYWVFDGYHSSITRYDFRIDHGPAGTDHSDGTIHRYVEGEVKRVPGVPSHMEFDRDTKLLYIADTGNGRVAVLDTKSGEFSSAMSWTENNDAISDMSHWSSAPMTTLIDGATVGLTQPSGLVLVDEFIIVSDHATGFIHAFEKATGEQVDYIDTGVGPGNITGLAYKDGAIYFADTHGNRVMRLEAKP